MPSWKSFFLFYDVQIPLTLYDVPFPGIVAELE